MKRFLTSTAALAAAIALATGFGSALAQDKGHVVVASWGGSFQDDQRKAIFEPFMEETGIEIIEATGPSLAKVRAMVESGNTEWDVSGMVPGDLLVLARDGLVEKLDYDNYFQGMMDDIVPEVVHPYGIGNFFYTKVIAFNTEAFPGPERPDSWQDVWDVEKFPGPRAIDAGDWVIPPLEYALMADGVAPEDLYPLDIERAYESLSKIQPNVAKFTTSSAMAPQMLVDGEAVVGAATLGRTVRRKNEGAPIDFSWNQGLIQFDYWIIPKNAPNYENAMKFIEFATRPEIQAAMVELQLLGPVNLKSFDHLSQERAEQLPSYPANLEKQVFLNADFWASSDAEGKSNVEKNQEMWNRWSIQ
nr:ABC transporter substrate-binding protein [Desulfuromonadales bacterium]